LSSIWSAGVELFIFETVFKIERVADVIDLTVYGDSEKMVETIFIGLVEMVESMLSDWKVCFEKINEHKYLASSRYLIQFRDYLFPYLLTVPHA
jgi:hypothetical protein